MLTSVSRVGLNHRLHFVGLRTLRLQLHEDASLSAAKDFCDLMPELAKWLRAAGLLQNGEWRADENRQRGTEFSDLTIQRGAQIGPYKILSVLGEGGTDSTSRSG